MKTRSERTKECDTNHISHFPSPLFRLRDQGSREKGWKRKEGDKKWGNSEMPHIRKAGWGAARGQKRKGEHESVMGDFLFKRKEGREEGANGGEIPFSSFSSFASLPPFLSRLFFLFFFSGNRGGGRGRSPSPLSFLLSTPILNNACNQTKTTGVGGRGIGFHQTQISFLFLVYENSCFFFYCV